MHKHEPIPTESLDADNELATKVQELSTLDPADAVEPTSEVLGELGRELDED